MYAIQLTGERGTVYLVKKVFKSMETADKYAKEKCGYIHTDGEPLEKVVRKSINKMQVID